MSSLLLESLPESEQGVRSQRLWLLLLRGAWFVVVGVVLQMYTLGLPFRIDYLVTVFPLGTQWSSLTFAEAQLLATWGIPLPVYFWTILLSDLMVAGFCLALGVLIFWRKAQNSGAILCSLLIISLGCSENNYTGVLGDVSIFWYWAHLGFQSLATYLGLIVFYTFPDGRFVPRWTRWLTLAYGLLMLLWLSVPSIPFNPLPNGNYNATPIRSTLVYIGWNATGVAAMTIRYRLHSTPAQRQQTKWAIFGLLLGLGTAISFYIGRWFIGGQLLAGSAEGRFVYEIASNLAYMLVLMVVVGCFTIAILRHQLWDIDLVIRRTLRYALWSAGLLAAFATSVFVSEALIRRQALSLPLVSVAVLLALGTLLWQRVERRIRAWQHPVPNRPLPALPPEPPARLRGPALLFARVAWLSLAGIVLTMYLSGAVPRLAALRQTSPPILGGSLILPAHLVPALAQWGLTLDRYAAWVFSIEMLIPACFFLAATFLFWRRGSDRGALFVSLLLLSFGATETSAAGGIIYLFPLWHWPMEILQALGAAMIITVFCTFPDGRFTLPWARPLTLSWCALVVLWLLFPALPFNIVNGNTFNQTPFLSLGFGLIWHLAALYALLHRYRTAQGTVRLQMQWMVYALTIVFVTTTARYTIQPALWALPINAYPRWDVLHLLLVRPLYWISLLVVPISVSVAIMQYKLWGIETVIRRTLLYAGLSLALIGVAFSSVVASQLLLRSLWIIDSDLTAVLTTLLCVLLFEPLKRGLQAQLDRHFDRVQVDFRPVIIAFGREINQLSAVPDLLTTLLSRSISLLKIAHGAVYLRAADGQFHLAHAEVPPLVTPTALAPALIAQLRPDTEWYRVSEPHWPLLLPIPALQEGERTVIGVLALGPRRSEEPYQRSVIEVLIALADRAGTAISIAQLVAYQLSPVGRAEALAQSLAHTPLAALAELHRLAQIALASPEQAGILAALPAALQRRGLPDLATLASGYRLIAESRDDLALLIAGLRTLADATAPPDLAPPVTPDQRALTPQLYRLCQIALEAEQVAALGLLFPSVLRLTSGDEPALPTPASLTSVVLLFQQVLRTLDGLPRQETIAGQLTCLYQARAQLDQIDSRLPSAVDLVERHIARRIVRHWLRLIDAQVRLSQGQARVVTRLITTSVVLAAEIRLVIAVSNRGQGPARQVFVEMELGAGYQAQEYQQHLTELAPGSTELMTFVLQRLADVPLRPTITLRYDDLIDAGAVQTLTLAVAVLPAPSWSGPLPNPYIAGMPLRPGSHMFVGRDSAIASIERAITRPLPTALVLTGQRRMGKTSLLQQLGSRLDHAVVAVYLDGQRIGIDPGMPRLYADIATKIAAALQLPLPDLADFAEEPVTFFIDQLLPQAFAAAQGRRLLLIIDEIEALEERTVQGTLDPAFFGVLRHLMQHESQLALICAGSHRLDELRPVAWTSIFNAALHYRLGDLPDNDARALITAPLGDSIYYDDLALDQLLHLSGGHPYFLQLFCQELIDQANAQQQTVLTLEHVLAILSQILIVGEAPLADLWGDSSADEQWVLVALARLLPLTAACDVPQLTAAISAYGLPVDRELLERALQQLCWRDILAAEEELLQTGARRYRWRLALFGHWIARTQALRSDTP